MPDYVLYTAMALGCLAFVLGLAIPAYATFVGRRAIRGLPSRDLAEECKGTVEGISRLIHRRSASDPSSIPHWHGMPDNATEEARRRVFEGHTEMLLTHSRETMAEFYSEYAVRVLWLFKELRARGLLMDEDEWWFEHPTNPLGIQAVVRKLGVACEELWRRG